MVHNSECLQLIEDSVVPCRKERKFGYIGPEFQCPLFSCEAKSVLEDPVRFKYATGTLEHASPNRTSSREIIFHRICPGVFRKESEPLQTALDRSHDRYS